MWGPGRHCAGTSLDSVCLPVPGCMLAVPWHYVLPFSGPGRCFLGCTLWELACFWGWCLQLRGVAVPCNGESKKPLKMVLLFRWDEDYCVCSVLTWQLWAVVIVLVKKGKSQRDEEMHKTLWIKEICWYWVGFSDYGEQTLRLWGFIAYNMVLLCQIHFQNKKNRWLSFALLPGVRGNAGDIAWILEFPKHFDGLCVLRVSLKAGTHGGHIFNYEKVIVWHW